MIVLLFYVKLLFLILSFRNHDEFVKVRTFGAMPSAEFKRLRALTSASIDNLVIEEAPELEEDVLDESFFNRLNGNELQDDENVESATEDGDSNSTNRKYAAFGFKTM